MSSNQIKPQFIQSAKRTIDLELAAIHQLLARIDASFAKACEYLLACRGRVIVMGMGKPGHIGRKIAATLASTGTPAFFVHPGEASHGDFGVITAQDVVLAISNSGNTQEILTLLPLIKRLNIPLIALAGNLNSSLAEAADVVLDVSVSVEACPLNLAPTSSTTVALVMGDALAIALLEAKGFTEQDFAFSHPGGRLGRRLLLRIDEIMHTGDQIPKVSGKALLSHALVEMSRKSLGMTAVVDEQNKLLGVFTDGDLRRALDKACDIHKTVITDVMTRHGTVIRPHLLAIEALNLMESKKITALLVVDEQDKVIGALNIHDLLRAGVV
ncbi:MAG: D-arabinose 5-phosphate isomerase [Gammaproteobacteria bacterium GWE2_42_36]|nr:MAG: D-arabinose 5-phosphate isomerase [Gammaproteobacteria bacterium GWE2_42_36]HCU05321.1 D-arabinose 5-phosphate isomerase [Coxiellaceae bacterium]